MAPATGGGAAPIRATILGKNASRIKIAPQAYPILRLTAPMAADNPTLLLELPRAKPPSRAEISEPSPKQRTAELPRLRSVRFQSASLIFSQMVRSPEVFSAELRPSTINGSSRSNRNARPGGEK